MALWGKKKKNQAFEDEGNAIGLTQAFAPISDYDEFDEYGDDPFAGFDKYGEYDEQGAGTHRRW